MIRILLALVLTSFSLLAQAALDPLPPERAFRLEAQPGADGSVTLQIRIEPGYYLYRDKFKFVAEPASVRLGKVEMPKGIPHRDEHFGEQFIYRDTVSLQVPLVASAVPPESLQVSLQGCADAGICYLPTTLNVPLAANSLPGRTGDAGGQDWRQALQTQQVDLPGTTPVQVSASAPALPASEDASHIRRLLAGGNLVLIALSFFGFGLLLCFTPCTLPMVPILSGIIVGHGHKLSHGRAFVLSTAYVLGMALTYAVAGVLAGFSGQLFSAWLQNAWVLGSFALIFVLLALAMFGVYEFQLPASWQHRLSASAHRHGGSVRQLALMGIISALIVGPCVAAPLAGALLYIARTHDAVLGGLALFALGLGMGAPLIVVGVAARRFLPKPGVWMEGVRRFFGLVLLATALYLVSPVLPPIVPMLGWAALLVSAGVFLRAIDPLPAEAHVALRVFKAIGILLLLAGAAIFIGALAGSRNPLQPLAGLRGTSAFASEAPRFERIKSRDELEARIAVSRLPVMLDFYADWCVSCKEMESRTFADPAIAQQLKGFALLQADLSANSAEDRALLARFGIFGPPGILFFKPGGGEIEGRRVIGFMPPERFGPWLANTTH